MLLKKLQLLKEDIYGNMATVYHRCQNLQKLRSILDRLYRNGSHIHFSKYSSALYTTYDMKSQTNQAGNLNDMEGTYGGVVIKFGVKGLRNFLFMSYSEYRKIDPKATQENYAERQVSRLCPDIDPDDAKALAEFIESGEHVRVGLFLEQNMLIGKVKGLQYVGRHDGNCLLVFDYSSLVPLAYTADNGKTWQKDYDGLDRGGRTVSDRLGKNESSPVKTEYPKDRNGWKVLSASSPAGARELLGSMGAWAFRASRDIKEDLWSQTKQDNKLYLVQHLSKRTVNYTPLKDRKEMSEGKYNYDFWLFNFSEDYDDAEKKHQVSVYSNRGSGSLQDAAVFIPENIRKAIRAGKYSLDDYAKAKEEKIDPDEKKKGFTDRKYIFRPGEGKPVSESEKPFTFNGKDYGRVMVYETGGKEDTRDSRSSKARRLAQSAVPSFFDSGERVEAEDHGWYRKAYIRYYYFENEPALYIKEYWRNGKRDQEVSEEAQDLDENSPLIQKLKRSTVGEKIREKRDEERTKRADRRSAVESMILSSARKAFGDRVKMASFSHNATDGSSITNRYPYQIYLYDDRGRMILGGYRKSVYAPRSSSGVWWSPDWTVDKCELELDKTAVKKWLNSVSAEIVRSHLLG